MRNLPDFEQLKGQSIAEGERQRERESKRTCWAWKISEAFNAFDEFKAWMFRERWNIKINLQHLPLPSNARTSDVLSKLPARSVTMVGVNAVVGLVPAPAPVAIAATAAVVDMALL